MIFYKNNQGKSLTTVEEETPDSSSLEPSSLSAYPTNRRGLATAGDANEFATKLSTNTSDNLRLDAIFAQTTMSRNKWDHL